MIFLFSISNNHSDKIDKDDVARRCKGDIGTQESLIY